MIAAFDSGELQEAIAGADDAYKSWVKAVGKAQKRKGKRLFMPLRVALTGSSHVRMPAPWPALTCCSKLSWSDCKRDTFSCSVPVLMPGSW